MMLNFVYRDDDNRRGGKGGRRNSQMGAKNSRIKKGSAKKGSFKKGRSAPRSAPKKKNH